MVEVPLRRDADGTLRIGNSRVLLEVLLGFYLQGESAEDLHDSFPSVPLADIHAVIAYYLNHREEVDTYMADVKAQGEALRREIEAAYTPEQRALHERLRIMFRSKNPNFNLLKL
jgi:uncharacterized protein (DUF433 family)